MKIGQRMQPLANTFKWLLDRHGARYREAEFWTRDIVYFARGTDRDSYAFYVVRDVAGYR